MVHEKYSDSPVIKFFDNSSILITGATGFLGKVLMQKILSCSDIDKLYLLVRSKKGKGIEQRMKELFDDVLFQPLLKEQPKVLSKVIAIPGDVSLPGLGISEEHQALLIANVNIVFHGAATVRFDENLKLAVNINVRGTQEILKLSKRMHKLKTFVHISTAYSNCNVDVIEEKFYDPPLCAPKILEMSDVLSDQQMEALTPSLLENWPNTYTLTKAIAEDIVKKAGSEIPTCVFRPAIVTSTAYEPLKGWIDNLYGPTGVVVGAGCGVLRTLHCDIKKEANIVPADLAVNAMIVAAWKTGTQNRNNVAETDIYNYISCVDNPIQWGEFMLLIQHHGVHIPPLRAIWYYTLTITKNRYLSLLLTLLLHFIPAYIVDGIAISLGKKPQLTKIYRKIHKFSTTISYFATRQWTFTNKNTQQLWKELRKEDKLLFNFNIGDLNWSDYLKHYILGARVYFLKDDLETLPEAQIKWKRLYWCHQVVKLVFTFLTLRLIWSTLKIIFEVFW